MSKQVKPIIFTPDNKPVRVFTEEQKQEIIRLRATKTPKQLAVMYNTQVFRIHRVLNSVPRPKKKKPASSESPAKAAPPKETPREVVDDKKQEEHEPQEEDSEELSLSE